MILVDGRRIMMSGPLSDDTATELCAVLVSLDGQSNDHIELVLNGSGGSLDGCASVLDVLGLLAAPVNSVVLGRAEGPVGLVAVCAPGERRAAPNATVSLRLDSAVETAIDDAPGSIEQAASNQRVRLTHLVDAVASRIGSDPVFIERELAAGTARDAETARSANFVDAIGQG